MRVRATILAIAAVVAAASTSPAARPRRPAASSPPVIVRLVSRDHTITVTAGPSGPLYSQTDAAGRVVVKPATLEQLRAQHSDLYRQVEPATAYLLDASAD